MPLRIFHNLIRCQSVTPPTPYYKVKGTGVGEVYYDDPYLIGGWDNDYCSFEGEYVHIGYYPVDNNHVFYYHNKQHDRYYFEFAGDVDEYTVEQETNPTKYYYIDNDSNKVYLDDEVGSFLYEYEMPFIVFDEDGVVTKIDDIDEYLEDAVPHIFFDVEFIDLDTQELRNEKISAPLSTNGTWEFQYPKTSKIHSILHTDIVIEDCGVFTPISSVITVDFREADNFAELVTAANMFEDSKYLESVNFGAQSLSNATSTDYMFSGCSKLSSITWSSGNSFDSLATAESMFAGVVVSSQDMSVVYGMVNSPQSVLTTALEDIELSFIVDGKSYHVTGGNTAEIIQSLDENIVYSGSLTIPSSVSIGGFTFAVTQIGSSAFSGCSDLTDVFIPTSINKIESYAFAATYLESVNIPTTVTEIGYDAFDTVHMIIYSGTATGANWGADILANVIDGDYIYSDNAKTDLVLYTGSASSIIVPSSVTTIDRNAFKDKTSITTLTIPSAVVTVNDNAFDGCTNIELVTTSSTADFTAANLQVKNNGIYYRILDKDSAWLIGSVSSLVSGAYTVATSFTAGNTFSVTQIKDQAFKNCTLLTSLTVPTGIESLGKEVFIGCTNLAVITIPDYVALQSNTFKGCTGLTSLVSPIRITGYDTHSLSSFGGGFGGLFEGCSSVVNFADIINTYDYTKAAISAIEKANTFERVFKDCTSLTDFDGNFVYRIGVDQDWHRDEQTGHYFTSMFENCTSLANVEFKNNFTLRVADFTDMFKNCTFLQKVKINSLGCGVESRFGELHYINNVITYGMFYNCPLLREVYLGVSDGKMLLMSNNAFVNCQSLESFTIYGQIAFKNSVSFKDCPNLSYDSMKNIANHLEVDNDTVWTVTFNTTAFGYLTYEQQDEIRDIVLDKNWQIAFGELS